MGKRQPFAEQQCRQGNQDASRCPRETPSDDAHQDRAFERNVGSVEVAYEVPDQHAQSDGNANDEDDFDLFAERAFFAKQQYAKAAGAHQHAADRRSHAEANQYGYENETRIQSIPSARDRRIHHGEHRGTESTLVLFAVAPLTLLVNTLSQALSYPACGFADGFFRADGIRRATLGHVPIAAASRAKLLERLLHQGAHVIRQAWSLGKYQRRLSSATGEERRNLVEADKFLRQQS